MLDSLSRAVVLAAVMPSNEARDYWYQAKSFAPISDWPDYCARILPGIYVNLADENDPEIAGLAKGFYRQTWSLNNRALIAASSFARELRTAEIDYRIIKGGAMALIHGKYGIRRMGDIDWVFHANSGNEVVSALIKSGFSPRYEFPDNRISEIWDDQDGNSFDIHLLSKGDSLMAAFDGVQEVAALQTTFKIPSYAALAFIAADHSISGHAESDLNQGLVDVASLIKFLEPDELSKLLVKYGKLRRLQPFFEILEELHFSNDKLERVISNSTQIAKLQSGLKSINNILHPTFKFRRKIFTPLSLRSLAPTKLSLRQLGYGLWLSFGSLRPIERTWIQLFGGFLSPAQEANGLQATIELSAESARSDCADLEVGRLDTNELRFAFTKKPGAKVDLHIEAQLENPTPRMLFINGIGKGHFTPRFSSRLAIPIDPNLRRVEVSLRDFSERKRPWLGTLDLRVEVFPK